MFYKKEMYKETIDGVENDLEVWYCSDEVRLPVSFDGEILNSENRKEVDGWQWHDEPSTEYLAWLDEQENKTPPEPSI